MQSWAETGNHTPSGWIKQTMDGLQQKTTYAQVETKPQAIKGVIAGG